ncbi:MAG: metal-dependent hydrolase [Methylobacter sp.]|nr:metal-dependent hydrolase [Methylococcales bacterium]MDD5114271.1 metal-dependent hydrolase [Methylobacter sp.]
MIIAHLPAGYIVSTLLFPRLQNYGVSRQGFMRAGLFGAVAPDLDMIYFYCFDERAHPHHSYYSHFPMVWLLLLILSAFWLHTAKRKELPVLTMIFAANGLLHMFLDFIASNIYWLAPFVNKPFSLITVPRVYEPWWLNFILHRAFGVEIAIVVAAIYLWRRDVRRETLNLSLNGCCMLGMSDKTAS